MYILIISQVINIEGWHLVLTSVGVVLSIIIAVWNIDRSRKKDFKREIDKKADLSKLHSELRTRDERISTINMRMDEHEKNNFNQFEGIKDNLEEIQSTTEHTNKRIDEIYKLLIKK